MVLCMLLTNTVTKLEFYNTNVSVNKIRIHGLSCVSLENPSMRRSCETGLTCIEMHTCWNYSM